MPKTISLSSAKLGLEAAQKQRTTLLGQIQDISGKMSGLAVGSTEWVEQAQLIADIRTRLDRTEREIEQYKELSRTEEEQAKLEADEQERLAKLQAEEDRKTQQEIENLIAIFERINRASDELAEAMKAVMTIKPTLRSKLDRSGRFYLDTHGDSTLRKMIAALPWCPISERSASMASRNQKR